MQQLNKHSYEKGVEKVQGRNEVRQRRMMLTRFGLSSMKSDVLEVDYVSDEAKVSFHRQQIEHREFCSVQMTSDKILQLQTSSGICRLLTRMVLSDGQLEYKEQHLETLKNPRLSSALAQVNNKQVIVSGGLTNGLAHNAVYRLSLPRYEESALESASWENLPSLNVARRDHASCSMGSSVFVFCGTAGDCSMSLNSIERLCVQQESRMKHWQLIRMPLDILEPRYQPAIAAINQHEIAIVGGWSREGFSRLGDVVIFDTRI